MTNLAGAPAEEVPPELTDLESPEVSTVAPSLTGPPVTPAQRLFFYSPDEWEQFIREWATGLGAAYVQIKRLGGANDRGVDVAAFKTNQGLEGSWDCFQGKHYAKALLPSDAFPEILKVLIGVDGGHYVLPDRYAFLAPRGCGSTLNRMLSKPTDLRDWFLRELAKPDGPASKLDKVDFAVFQSVEIDDALETHRATPYHSSRFGTALPARPARVGPAPEIAAHESRYVAQLFEVYYEMEPTMTFTAENMSAHSKFGSHFQRQRESFYSAEALRLYARDSVPLGTYEALQSDVHSGVVEVAEASHQSGMDRLTTVLATSGQIDLSAHALISVSSIDDRKGICHQLANEDRLTWVKEVS
jgi:hypothetical protein